MDIRLNEKTAEMVSELAKEMGLTPDEVVGKIIEWYAEDCRLEK